MATSTTYLSLIKPELADTTKIREDFNTNMDTIDGRFSATYMAIQAKNAVTITGGSITGITDLVVSDGGTGVSTLTDGGILLGSGTGAITAMAVLTDGQMIVGNGTTDPVAESGATLRTSIDCTSRALDNISSCAINTSLLSDTEDTDSLGSTAKEWLNLYIGDAGKIYIGLEQDLNIYRSAANTMTLTASSGVTVTGTLTAPFLKVYRVSESTALNASWLQISSTVATGDLTGLRTVMTSDAASGGGAATGVNVRGVYSQAICTASKHAGLLQGGLFTAGAAAGTVYNVHVLCGHYSSGGATTIGGDLYVGYLRAQTRQSGRSVTGNDCLLALENEAVSGTGQIMDSAIRIFDTNMGVDGFTYGIDMSSANITTADIILQNSETISNATNGTITFGAANLTTTGSINGASLTLDTALAIAEGGTGVTTGAMTGITSVLNAALYVGRDVNNTVSFATDNKILFKTNSNLCMEILPTGELDMNAFSVVFTEQALTSGTAVAWDLGNSNKATLTAAHNFTITITAPSGAMNAQLIITQDSTGSRVMDEIVTQSDATIATTDVHTDTEIIDLTVDIPTGARIRFKTDSADLAEPLVVDTIYWAIRSSENHIKVATTKANAIAGTNVDITDTGTGTHTVQQLVKWIDGTLGVLTTDAGAEDILSLTYKIGDKQWYAVLNEDFS